MLDETYRIPLDKALSMLPDSDEIHTIRNRSVVLLGADWPRQKIIETLEKYGAFESGENASKMNHCIVTEDAHGSLWIETKKHDKQEQTETSETFRKGP